MSQELTVEQRFIALEREVALLRNRLDALAPEENWFERISGSMKDNPAFDEVVRLGAEFRNADRPKDEPEPESQCSSSTPMPDGR